MMRCRRFATVTLLLASSALASSALAWSENDQERYQSLLAELRCLVCQNQSIADSAAPLAEDLRSQVRNMIESGESDRRIRDYMTARYGDFVLYRPPLKPATWALWFGPFAVLALGLFAAWRLRRRGQSTPAPDVDPAALKRILDTDE